MTTTTATAYAAGHAHALRALVALDDSDLLAAAPLLAASLRRLQATEGDLAAQLNGLASGLESGLIRFD